jgi:hypothetical protein
VNGRGDQADRRDEAADQDRRSRPDPWSAEAIRVRLDRLPTAHPSSPRYHGGHLNRPVNLRALEFTDEQVAELAAQRGAGAPLAGHR